MALTQKSMRRSKCPYHVVVSAYSKDSDRQREWIKQNVKGEWTVTFDYCPDHDGFMHVFGFDDEQTAILFKLFFA
jgi:hypothetical protein